MDMPPRRVGKRLIGRYLFLRIMLGTIVLIVVVIGSVFWAKDVAGYDLDHQRSIAFNVLDFGAISICLSARFSYNSSMHPRLFRGNAFCWWSVLIVAVLSGRDHLHPRTQQYHFQYGSHGRNSVVRDFPRNGDYLSSHGGREGCAPLPQGAPAQTLMTELRILSSTKRSSTMATCTCQMVPRDWGLRS